MERSTHPLRTYTPAILVVMLLLLALPIAPSARAAGARLFIANTFDDAVDAAPGDTVCETVPGNGLCSLRAAIQEANATPSDDPVTIDLRFGTYALSIPGAGEDRAATGDLDITYEGQLSIFGSVSFFGEGTIIDGGGLDRVFDIGSRSLSGQRMTIQNLTIQNGRLTPASGGFRGHSHGAGIHNHSNLILKNVTIRNNTVDNTGSAETWGGGLSNDCGTPDPSDERCFVHEIGDARLENVTISGNRVVGNGSGSGIENSRTLSLNNVTIGNNTAPTGGAALFSKDRSGSFTNIRNTILADNPGGENCSGTIRSRGYNLSSDASCAAAFTELGDLNNVAARLAPLEDNGGGTPTHALLRDSPAIDGGSRPDADSDRSTCAFADQRGVARPQDGNGDGVAICDIGAYELEPTDTDLSISMSDLLDPVQVGTPMLYTIEVFNPFGAPRAAAVRVVDSLPAGVTFDSVFDDRGGTCSHAAGVVTCDLGILNSGSVWIIRLFVTATAVGTIVNTASVSAVGSDPDMGNNTISESTTVTAPPQQSGNLLKNPGFELDADHNGKPDNWTENDHFTRRSAIRHNGDFAGRHRATDNSDYQISQTVKDLQGGATYRFSGWVNIPDTRDAFTFRLQVRWRDINNATISTDTVKTYTTSTRGWNRALATLVAPAGTSSAQIRMIVGSLDGTIYVDDFAFRQVITTASVGGV